MRNTICTIVVRSLTKALLLFALSVHAQGSFQNLGFELATISPVPGDLNGRIYFAAAFPNWTGYCNGIEQTTAYYNAITLSAVDVAIIDDNGSSVAGVIDGNYTAILQGGDFIGGGPSTIMQSGVVPGEAQSLQIKIYTPPATPFAVSMDGQALSLMQLGGTSTYTLYGADVSSYAGEVHDLAITALPGNHFLMVDSILFSTIAIVPEPSELSLVGLGLLVLGGHLRRRWQK